MASKFKWADSYQKQGFKVFSDESIKSLRLIQRKYTHDYLEFFKKVDDTFAGMPMTPERKQVNRVIEAIQEAVYIVDKLLATTSVPESKEQVQTLADLMENIDKAFIFFSNPDNLSAPTQKRIQEVEKKSGISVQDIAKANKAIKGRVEEAGKVTPSIFGRAGSVLASGVKPLGDMAHKALASGAFGPIGTAAATIGGLAGKGVKGVSDFMQRRKEKKLNLERQAFSQSALLQGEATPEGFSEMFKGLRKSGVGSLGEDLKKGGGTKYSGDAFEGLGASGGEAVFGTAKTRKSATMQIAGMQQALFSFFNVDAYRARWTKELLEVIKEGGGKGGRGGIPKDSIGKVLGVAGLGAAIGGGIGYVLNKVKFPGDTKSVGERISDMVPVVAAYKMYKAVSTGKKIKAQQQALFDAREARLGPERDLRMSLIQRGMDPQEAYIKAKEQIQKARGGNIGEVAKPGGIAMETTMPSSVEPSPTPEVPVATPDSSVATEIQSGNKVMKDSLDELNKGIKKIGDQSSSKPTSGYDAYNTRDPLLSSLNSGMLGIN